MGHSRQQLGGFCSAATLALRLELRLTSQCTTVTLVGSHNLDTVLPQVMDRCSDLLLLPHLKLVHDASDSSLLVALNRSGEVLV
jgi:hypothetical protein